MDINEFFEKIGLSERARKAALEYDIPEVRRGELKRLFYSDEKAFYRELETLSESKTAALRLFSEMAAELYPKFIETGVSDRIYTDTFHDFAIWSDVCERREGEIGLTEYGWVSLPLKMEIFRLGRLQFQPSRIREEIVGEISAHKGEPSLEVHIPEGEPLLPAEVRSSFEEAAPFFRKYFNHDYKYFHCHSWLLSPQLKKLLPNGSNILEFQKNFSVYIVEYSFRQAEERVFGEIRGNISSYPEKTALQRSLKEYLLGGGAVGNGGGIALTK